MRKFKVGALFSGVGGIELGFTSTKKFEISWANELDKYCARTYRENFNHTFLEKDINTYRNMVSFQLDAKPEDPDILQFD